MGLSMLLGCGGPLRTGSRPDAKPGDPPLSSVEVAISGLSRSDAEAFRGQILGQGEISNVVLKSFVSGVATYTLDIKGCECELPAKIARIQSPGFRYQGRTSTLKFEAFDNKPPEVVFVHPETDDRELTEPSQLVTVEVRDSDVKEVRVNGVLARRVSGDFFHAPVELREGGNEIAVVAEDTAGNVTRASRTVTLRRSPSGNPSLRMLVEGRVAPGSTVLIEGKNVPVDVRGHYSITISTQPGQKQIEIIAIAPDGKKSVTVKEIGAP